MFSRKVGAMSFYFILFKLENLSSLHLEIIMLKALSILSKIRYIYVQSFDLIVIGI